MNGQKRTYLASDPRLIDLQTLLRRLTYFGRAESWCEATAHTDMPPAVKPDESHWCCLALDTGVKPEGREQVEYTLERKLTPLTPLKGGLRNEMVQILSSLDFKIFETKIAKKSGKTSQKWVKAKPAQRQAFREALAVESEALSLLRCLLRSSGEDIQDGLERPIGSRWIHYAVPRAIHQLPQPQITLQPKPVAPPITLARFALNTATVNLPVLPPLADALLFAGKSAPPHSPGMVTLSQGNTLATSAGVKEMGLANGVSEATTMPSFGRWTRITTVSLITCRFIALTGYYILRPKRCAACFASGNVEDAPIC